MVTRCQKFVQRGSKGRRGQRENGCTAMAETGLPWQNLCILHTHISTSVLYSLNSLLWLVIPVNTHLGSARLWLWNRKLPVLDLHTGTYVTRKWATACCMSYCLDMNSRPGLFIPSSKSVLPVTYYLYYVQNKITKDCWPRAGFKTYNYFVFYVVDKGDDSGVYIYVCLHILLAAFNVKEHLLSTFRL